MRTTALFFWRTCCAIVLLTCLIGAHAQPYPNKSVRLIVPYAAGGPADATRTIVQHIYETGFKDRFALGASAAMSLVLSVLILVFSLIQFRFLRGRTEY